jgi:hypothetical protein
MKHFKIKLIRKQKESLQRRLFLLGLLLGECKLYSIQQFFAVQNKLFPVIPTL